MAVTSRPEAPSALDGARALLNQEWEKKGPITPDEIDAFYRDSENVERDLDAWHATADRQSWTEMVVFVAGRIKARSVLDIGCGVGHDLMALRGAGIPILQGVEPNRMAREECELQGLTVVPSVYACKIDEADLILMIDVLEHVPNPEEYLTWIAERAHPNAVLIETTATHDVGLALHLEANRGWHPGRALERQGWTIIDQRGRVRVWQRMAEKATERASLIVMAYRAVSVPTYKASLPLVAKNWRILVQTGDALVSRARSIIASRWWRETSDDVFLMIDDDVNFDISGAEQLVKVCREDHPIVCAAYPVRSGQHFAFRAEAAATLAFKPDAEPLPIRYPATGFMAVHRKVLDAMIPTLPLVHADQEWSFWPLFMPFVDVNHKTGLLEMLSEDYAFANRARALGFQSYLDPSIRLGHLSLVELNVANMGAVHDAISEPA